MRTHYHHHHVPLLWDECCHLCLSWNFFFRKTCITLDIIMQEQGLGGAVEFLCLANALTATIESWLSLCTGYVKPMNHGITHHCRLEHVNTARYTLLTRSDITRMSQPVWMSLSLSFLSLSLSSCLCSVSIYSSLLCCTSPQLPVFHSFGLFSLNLSLPLCLLLVLPPLVPPPVRHPSICSRL